MSNIALVYVRLFEAACRRIILEGIGKKDLSIPLAKEGLRVPREIAKQRFKNEPISPGPAGALRRGLPWRDLAGVL